MLILWIRKSKTGEPASPKKYDKDSLRKHDEEMKRFRLTHPKTEAIKNNDVVTVDGNMLAAVQNVKLTKNTQN